jgi:tRNA nucleotidyltransferase (CCA-adding enzyme)
LENTVIESHWELLPHGADIGVRGVGVSKAQAFEQAALALTAVITDPASVIAKQRVEIACEAEDDELLLVNWLNAVIYEMAIRKMLFARFEVNIQDTSLNARLWGEAVDIPKHQPAVEIKGATLTNLAVRRDDDGHWSAQCVVDV